MAFDFSVFNRGESGTGLDEQFVDWLVNERAIDMILHYEKLWRYYCNDMRELDPLGAGANQQSETARPYRQAQEYGLPSRITGMNYSFYGGVLAGRKTPGISRKEVVVENDIAWRINTLVDFLFGKRLTISSRAKDDNRAAEIEQILNTVFSANGGITYFQELALLGSVYGFVDVILRLEPAFLTGDLDDVSSGGVDAARFAAARPRNFEEVLERSRHITLEAIEAPRALPILDEDNYRKIDYFVQHFWQQRNRLADGTEPTATVDHGGRRVGRQSEAHNVEVIGPQSWQRYQDAKLVAEGINPLGVVPVVHIQNMPMPMRYEGQSEVEPLLPLQDELNTRLSDRASRISFQSFKMYLGKGIEGFEDRVVAPWRMWSTDNPDAAIEEFGGDAGSPSEDAHISQIREAMEKASGVASVAAGILKGRVGNLTSAVALKVTLMGVLAKTERKRQSYGKGIAELSRLVLLALDKTGVYPNEPSEREIEIHWPSPLPENLTEKLQEGVLKQQLGLPSDEILKELGYSDLLKV
jgi:hypothetical protein